jgi:hypothetical protein
MTHLMQINASAAYFLQEKEKSHEGGCDCAVKIIRLRCHTNRWSVLGDQ